MLTILVLVLGFLALEFRTTFKLIIFTLALARASPLPSIIAQKPNSLGTEHQKATSNFSYL